MVSRKNKALAIVQARMDSKRLPGKSLRKIGEWSLVELVMKRVNRSSRIDQVVLATSENPSDDVLEEHVSNLGFPVFRGSEEDVLSRFYGAAKAFEASIVARVTGDCPLISPTLIDLTIQRFAEKDVDYLTLSIGEDRENSYPRGFEVEIVSFESLAEAAEKATKPYEREHVMPYFYTREDLFTVEYIEPEPEYSRSAYRLCVDTEEDLELILELQRVFKDELIEVDYERIIRFLDENPQIAEINKSVEQKHYREVDERFG